MPADHDPEAIEIKYLLETSELKAASVLEIGCGDGRLTWHYADRAARVVGTDPEPNRLALAQKDCPQTLFSKLSFALAKAEGIPFPNDTFDHALMAWSF